MPTDEFNLEDLLKKFNKKELANVIKNNADSLSEKDLFNIYSVCPALKEALITSKEPTAVYPKGFSIHHAPTILKDGSVKHPDYIDYFRVLQVLGEGGMGAVYKAIFDEQKAKELGKTDFDISITKATLGYRTDENAIVAIKVIKPEIAERMIGGMTRFKRELDVYKELGDISADIKNGKGGILPILEEGNDYFVMPILHPIEKKKLTEKDATTLGYNATKIIAEVHKRGKIHRDIKPDNFLLAKKDDYTSVVASDFGLVKNIGEEVTMRTMSQAIMGTPDYMSPEQANAQLIKHLHKIDEFYNEQEKIIKNTDQKLAQELTELEKAIQKEENSTQRRNLRTKRFEKVKNKIEEIKKTKNPLTQKIEKLEKNIQEYHNLATKTDQYSLAATIYTWATGQKPKYTKSEKKEEHEEDNEVLALLNNITDPNTDLIYFPQELGISDNLSAVILKGMEKNPADRYATTDDFATDLEKVMNGETPSVLINDPGYLERRMMKKAGADEFLKMKKYRMGREALDKIIEDLQEKLKKNPNDKELVKQKEKWQKTSETYIEKMRTRLTEMKEYMSSCPTEEFVANIPEFLELIYEVKIVPVEKRIGDGFPTVTIPDGKWQLDDGISVASGFWIDILRSGRFDINNRLSLLKEQEKKENDTGFFEIFKSYLIFGKEYDKTNDKESQGIFLKRLSKLEDLYKKNNEQFIPHWDKEKLDNKDIKLGGTVLSAESLGVIEALFNANKHVPDNKYAKMAIKHIDAVIDNLMREDGSVFRFGILNKEGKFKKIADKLRHHLGIAKENEIDYDKFDENGNNISRHTWHEAQAYFVKGLVDSYKHSRKEKYKEKAKKAIDYFIDNFSDDLSEYRSKSNLKERNEIRIRSPTSIALPSIIEYSILTEDIALKGKAIEIFKTLIKNRFDTNKDFDGLIRGPPDGNDQQKADAVDFDYFILNALSKLETNVLYEPRNFVSIKTEQGKPDWNNSNYQYGFTRLDNAVADEQTEVRVMHDDENIYFRLRAFGDFKNDFYDILIGNKKFKAELDNGIAEVKLPYSELGLENKPKELKFNIVRNRKDEKGRRTTISSWSPNEADLYFTDKVEYYFDITKTKIFISYGTLILKD